MMKILKYGFYGMIISYALIKIIEYLFFLIVPYEFITVTIVLSSIICGCAGRIVGMLQKSNEKINNNTKYSNE